MALDADTETAVRAFAEERRYHPATVERWLQLNADDAAGLLELARELRLGEHQLRDLWTWAEEIAERDASSLATVLSQATIGTARRRPLSRNDRLKLTKGALRRLRFPQLSATEDQLAEQVRALALPPTVRVILPDCLEGDALRLEILADSVAALRTAAAALLAAADTPGCARLFRLLAEAP